jgi:hypothetical protein
MQTLICLILKTNSNYEDITLENYHNLLFMSHKDHRGLSSGLLKLKKIFKNLILIKIYLWEPSENNADKFQ